jgi:hypothetical protein
LKTFYINPETNDLEFDGSNNLKMVSNDDEIVQSVRMLIKTNVNEWFLNIEHGFDWLVVQTKNIDEAIITDALYAAILQETRIATVEDLQFNFDAKNRKMNIDFKLTKVSGGTIEGGLIV